MLTQYILLWRWKFTIIGRPLDERSKKSRTINVHETSVASLLFIFICVVSKTISKLVLIDSTSTQLFCVDVWFEMLRSSFDKIKARTSHNTFNWNWCWNNKRRSNVFPFYFSRNTRDIVNISIVINCANNIVVHEMMSLDEGRKQNGSYSFASFFCMSRSFNDQNSSTYFPFPFHKICKSISIYMLTVGSVNPI